MNFKNYLDGAGSVSIFPPRRKFRLDFGRARAVLDAHVTVHGMTPEEAFHHELSLIRRASLEFQAGSLAMFVLVLLGMLGTLYLATRDYPTWIALAPHLACVVLWVLAQIRYDRVVADENAGRPFQTTT